VSDRLKPDARSECRCDLLRALAGKCAGDERAAADRTRRVVMASLGVLQEQKASRKRSRSVAVAALLLMTLALGPFAWHLADELIEGEHICDVTTQLSLAACILCPAILAAALVAGWLRNRS
jgi:hypothetical protein